MRTQVLPATYAVQHDLPPGIRQELHAHRSVQHDQESGAGVSWPEQHRAGFQVDPRRRLGEQIERFGVEGLAGQGASAASRVRWTW